jgi:lipopolysaccharide export system protein LptA
MFGTASAFVVSAQQAPPCQLELVSVGGIGRQIAVMGGVHSFAAGGVFARCVGQPTTMRADSVAWYSERDRMDFTNAVEFRDSTMRLNADRATYYASDERLEAFGNVRLVNRETGSVLSGPRLTYYRDAPAVRDSAEIFAVGRPHVEYRSTTDSTMQPYVIVADRVRLRGETAWAGGQVTIDRDDLAARGDSAELHTGAGTGLLLGDAEAVGQDSSDYRLVGKRIDFLLERDELRWLRSQDEASASSSDWQIAGDTVEFDVARDRVQGGRAWGTMLRPRAVSDQHTIEADSLELDAPEQVLTEVRAFGQALAASGGDTLTGETDWLAGDSLTARFEDAESGGRVLREMRAVGNGRAFYHIYPEGREGVAAINYVRGRIITVRFTDDALDRVDVVDAADGIYLEPPRKPKP